MLQMISPHLINFAFELKVFLEEHHKITTIMQSLL